MAKVPPEKAGPAVVPLRPARKCPICGKPSVRAYYPFDSRRCADIDLGKWLSGGYAIPAVETEPNSAARDGSPGEPDENP